jgi:hypothetical protein
MDQYPFMRSPSFTMDDAFIPMEPTNECDRLVEPTPISVQGTVLVVDKIESLPQDLTSHCEEYIAALSNVKIHIVAVDGRQDGLGLLEPEPVQWNNSHQHTTVIKDNHGWFPGQDVIPQQNFQAYQHFFEEKSC